MKTGVRLVCMILCLVPLMACGGAGGSDQVPAGPGEPIRLSERVQSEVVPQAVVPYGGGPGITLADLQLENRSGTIYGRLSYTEHQEGEFTLVVYCSTPERLLVEYLDPEQHLTLALPHGTVLFGLDGYEKAGGTIEFSVPLRMVNVYNITGQSGKVHLFTVAGKVNPRSTLPGDQRDPAAFQANSNVLETGFDF